jgi:hypothetical protein
MQTTYRIVAFGYADYGFFNRPLYKAKREWAYNSYQNCIADPDFDGAVLIEVEGDTWKVIEEFGTEGYTVECGPAGNFKVTKSPELVMV